MTSHENLAARDQACLWHPYTQMLNEPPPLEVVRGAGVYLYTADGRRVLDGVSSWWVNIHGHAHPVLNAALARQAGELEHVIFAGCTHPPAVELAERLVALLPAGLTRVFYSDNGSTAVEVALKLTWQYWQNRGEPERRTFIALDHAYHGDTVGAMSVSAASSFTAPFEPLLFPVVRVDDPYCHRCPVGLDRTRCRIDCLAGLEARLAELGPRAAGVLVEPMLQGVGGMIVWPREFLAGVRSLCDRYGTLMLADEVLTGFGRTGPDVRLRARGGRARHHLPVQGADRGLPAARGHRRRRADLRGVPERRPPLGVLPRALLHGQPPGLRRRRGQPRPVPGRGRARAHRTARSPAPVRAGAVAEPAARGRRARHRRRRGRRARNGHRHRGARHGRRLLRSHRAAAGRRVPAQGLAAAAARQRAVLHAALRHLRRRGGLGRSTPSARCSPTWMRSDCADSSYGAIAGSVSQARYVSSGRKYMCTV